MSQRSRRSYPNSIRFQRQPGATVRQQRRRFRQHRARERSRVNHVFDANRARLCAQRAGYDVDGRPLGTPGAFWWRLR